MLHEKTVPLLQFLKERQSVLMGKHSLACIFQIIAICVSLFGIIAAIVLMVIAAVDFVGAVRHIFTILFCAALLLIELYIFSFFKYFGFLLKCWGKGLMYLLVGALLFQTSGLGLFAAIVFWILAVVFGIIAYFLPVTALPLFQGGVCGKSPPDVSVTANDVYEPDSGSGGK